MFWYGFVDEESADHISGVRQSAKITFDDDYLFGNNKSQIKKTGVNLEERVVEGHQTNQHDKIIDGKSSHCNDLFYLEIIVILRFVKCYKMRWLISASRTQKHTI